jgi:hypothetical protein
MWKKGDMRKLQALPSFRLHFKGQDMERDGVDFGYQRGRILSVVSDAVQQSGDGMLMKCQ